MPRRQITLRTDPTMDGDIHIADTQPCSIKIWQCTPNACTQDDDQYKMECAECHRLLHYKCTQLPKFQVQLFLTKGYRKFICVNCVEIPEYLEEIIPHVHAPPVSPTKTMIELTSVLNLCAVENESFKVNNIALTNEANNLRAEFDIQVIALKKHKEDVTQLQSEIAMYKNSMKALEENEAKLKTIINNQEKDYRTQQETFNQAGNPDFDAISKLEEVMKRKLEEVRTTMVSKVKITIDEKLTTVDNKMATINPGNEIIEVGTSGSTFSKVLQLPTEVKQIMQDAKNEEKVQEKEQEGRAKNFIIHGADEVGNNIDEIKVNDIEYIAQILMKIGTNSKPESIARLGKPNETNKRTMKIVMNTRQDKERVMANLNKLKDTEEEFGKIRITDDYTNTEREQIRMWVKKAEEKSSSDTKRVYRVRGDPKNGLRLVSFLRK